MREKTISFTVFCDKAPFSLAEGAVLLPAPPSEHHPGRGLTEWFDSESTGDVALQPYKNLARHGGIRATVAVQRYTEFRMIANYSSINSPYGCSSLGSALSHLLKAGHDWKSLYLRRLVGFSEREIRC